MTNSLIRDYLTLRISAQDFSAQIRKNDELLNAIRAKIPDSTCAFDEVWKDCPLNVEAFEYCDFDLRRILTDGYYSVASVSGCNRGYDLIYELFRNDFPEVAHCDYYDKIASFAIDVVPEVVDSVEAGWLLMHIIESTKGMKKGRKKATRDMIREAFYLNESRKRPQWAQSSLWPIGTGGKPMRFLDQKTDGDMVRYRFEDVDTHAIRTVIDYY